MKSNKITFYDELTNQGIDDHLIDLFKERSLQNSYWSSAFKFFDEHKERFISEMSERQRRWAIKICHDINEMYEESFNN